jgi:hypothetical protein
VVGRAFIGACLETRVADAATPGPTSPGGGEGERSKLLGNLLNQGSDWVRRWQEVTFAPTALFSSHNFKLDTTAFLFSTGCLFAGYLSAIISAVAYFGVWYPNNLREHLEAAEKLKTTIEVLTVIAAVYVMAYLVSLLVTASASYLVFRAFGTKRPFELHFAAELHFFNLEPLAAIALTVLIINRQNNHPLLSGIMFAAYAVTRFYYLVLAYLALDAVHGLRRSVRSRAFWLGYVPPALTGLFVQVGLTWMLGLFTTSGFD